MSRLLETIRLQNGRLMHLPWHQMRLDKSLQAVYPDVAPIDLASVISVPDDCKKGIFKCRVTYARRVERIVFVPYRKKEIRSLRLLHTGGFRYDLKFAERRNIEKLYEQRGVADDVLMVRDGLLTDTSIANIALFDGGDWYTPAAPLLRGTCRMRLLAAGVILEKDIPANRWPEYEKIRIFNAMTGWQAAWEIVF